jgi:predicted ATP-grasp superfamily ATP-dependent carboligase
MFRVLITDASSKHCLPLQRHIRAALPDVELIGHDVHFYPLCKHYGYLHSLIRRTPLDDVLARREFDMVIPVGGHSVAAVARRCPEMAMLPTRESLECCFDKSVTTALAERLDIPTPTTMLIKSLDDLTQCQIPYPCVIKPACEVEVKGVYYAHNKAELDRFASRLLCCGSPALEHGILVQEYVAGTGVGFFALFDRGEPKRIFMHRRIREYPLTGGASTAARAYRNPTLEEYGLRILRQLQWHGPAMVEFKLQEPSRRFVLIEINPKLWGSLELSLEAGVNFGADLIRAFRGESLQYSDQYDRNLEFYWPLDDDLLHLLHTRQIGKIREYWRPNARTNLGYSHTADVLKTIRMLCKLLRGK